MVWFAALMLITSVAIGEQASPIPLEKGTVWRYEGAVSWTVVNSSIVKSDHIRWTTRVIESYDIPVGHVAVVIGLPIDLAWYEPGQSPKLSLLVLDNNKLFQLPMESEQAAHDAVERLRKGSTDDYESAEPLLDLPLTKFKKWANDPTRIDDMYCWFVTEDQTRRLMFPGFRSHLRLEALHDHLYVASGRSDVANCPKARNHTFHISTSRHSCAYRRVPGSHSTSRTPK